MMASGDFHLYEKSSYLTTFNTHHGRYRFWHMPFGLKMSQDVFQMWMDQATDHLPSIIVIHDDICPYSCTPKDHDWYLLQLMQTAKQHGIVFNSSKCQIRQPQMAFHSAVITAQGMWPDPAKIQANQDLPTPNFQVKLWAFPWLTTYNPLYPTCPPKQHSCANSSPNGIGILDGCNFPVP